MRAVIAILYRFGDCLERGKEARGGRSFWVGERGDVARGGGWGGEGVVISV
jgi:hypothetical protein